MSAPLAPGGTSVTALAVYDAAAPDGLAGGSPHLHTVATEAYLVTAGTGELHTIDADGWRSTLLEPGATVWFSPGVIHRAVNTGGLEVRVVMSHAGLPEAGDAVLTFPDEVLADADRYAAAASLPGPDVSREDRLAAALHRRDLAVAGYRELLIDGPHGPQVEAERLQRLRERAAALVRPRVDAWRELSAATVDRVARETAARLSALARGDAAVLGDAHVAVAAHSQDYGMCGVLMRESTAPGGDR
ncbi:cupin domain-containing protein [uncultured Demequina sp.]|uniref:cupin domain-containing protein n=1 Tax=uncultured Demequina sp. TaxID=693499 RepID=UPI0025CC2E62|nr:cupin domain-containing protein [uncultured Demequina sp.]